LRGEGHSAIIKLCFKASRSLNWRWQFSKVIFSISQIISAYLLRQLRSHDSGCFRIHLSKIASRCRKTLRVKAIVQLAGE